MELLDLFRGESFPHAERHFAKLARTLQRCVAGSGDGLRGLASALQITAVHRGDSFFPQALGYALRLLAAKLGQGNILVALKAVLTIPFSSPMAHEDYRSHGAAQGSKGSSPVAWASPIGTRASATT